MTRPLVNVRLADDVTARLDAVAASRGLSRSDAIREAIESYIASAGKCPAGHVVVMSGPMYPEHTYAQQHNGYARCGYSSQTIDKPSYSH